MPLNLKIAADMLHVIDDDDIVPNRGHVIRLYAGWICFVQIYALFRYLLQFTG